MESQDNYSAACGSAEAGRVHTSRLPNMRRGRSNDVKVTSGRAGLPAIPNASVHRENPPQNPLSLNVAESKARANRIVTQERWRSVLLEYEVGLKELVTNSTETPPSGMRTMRTFQLYDSVTRTVALQSPELADILKMFRVEFCRAIFTQPTLGENVFFPGDGDLGQSEELGSTYFDQVEMLLRENAALHLEVNLGNTRDNLAQLRQDVERLQETLTYYENEVSRLERENERYATTYVVTKDELTKEQEKNRKAKDDYENMRMRLLQENKDLHLRICRLRKCLSDNESVFVKDAYKVIKEKRMGVLQSLFEQGDERVVILVMLSQLECRLNELLDQYDKEVLFGDDSGEYEQCRRSLGVAALLMEEMHLCELRYLQLLPTDGKLTNDEQDETDVFASLLTDPRVYEALVARVNNRQTAIRSNTQPLRWMDANSRSEAASRMTLAVYKGKRMTSPMPSNTQESVLVGREMCDTVAQVAASAGGDSMLQSQADNPEGLPGEAPNESFCHLRTLSSQEDSKEASRKKVCEETTNTRKPLLAPHVGGMRSTPDEIASFVQLPEDIFDEAKRKQEEWVTNILGTNEETNQLLQRLRKGDGSFNHLTEAEQLLKHILVKPMLDISTNKFQCGIDVFTGPGQHTQALLCSVNHIDPVEPVTVPQGARFLHIKYRNILREEAVIKSNENTPRNLSVTEVLEDWGGKTTFTRADTEQETKKEDMADILSKSHLFGELKAINYPKSLLKGVAACSSTSTAAAVFLRLNPMSPNRSPEWLLYQNMFGAYRPITPRLIDVSTIGHILLNSCERHFLRAEERYLRCLEQTKNRATNSEMVRTLVETAFRETYVLTDFQESFVKELESRYCYPELVAKTMYEILCYFDATMATQPLVDLYLSCIRGFESPTRIHYITYVMHQISSNWPSSNPEEAIEKEDVLTLLEHIYKRSITLLSTNPCEIVSEYQLATHSAPITLNALRDYLVTAMLHYEDPLSLYFNGLLSYRAKSNSVVSMNYEQFESALEGTWEEAVEGKLFIRYLVAGCGFNKSEELSTKELACVATSMWSSHMWRVL